MALIGLDARMAGVVPTGLGTYATRLARALTRLDAAHSYVIIRQRGGDASIAQSPNATEVIVDGDIDAPANLLRGGAISRLGLDLYHSLHHFLPLGLRVPRVVITLHDLIWIEHRRLIRSGGLAPLSRPVTNLYARAAMRYALRRADRVVAISEYTASRGTAVFGLDTSKVAVVPHGVDHSEFPPADPGAAPGHPPYFLCVGNTRPYKDIPTAFRAFARLRERRAGRADGAAEHVRLVVTGRGDTAGQLRQLARALLIDDAVTFTGSMPPSGVLRLLHGALALVFPSIVEGFGFPVLEAMSAGCPVITSRAPAIVEVAGDAALCCNAGDVDAFAAAMTRALDEPALRADLSAAGVCRAAAFTWERTAARTLAVYNALLADR